MDPFCRSRLPEVTASVPRTWFLGPLGLPPSVRVTLDVSESASIKNKLRRSFICRLRLALGREHRRDIHT